VLVLVTGANKHHAVRLWRQGWPLPIRHIAPHDGVDVWLDRAAAGDCGEGGKSRAEGGAPAPI
jgi:hypothetical protein